MTDEELKTIREAFETRVNAMFWAEAGKPLNRAAKRPPLSPGRGNYVRHYSFSICEFATRCFYLNERLDEANDALIENAQHYLDHPKDINDRDSFHWHAEMVLRFIEQYGSNGSIAAGRMGKAAEEKALEPMWIYAQSHSKLSAAEIDTSQTWHIHESENHHVQIFTTAWHIARLLKDHPLYATRQYEDGGTPSEHYAAWTAYIKTYGTERAKKGLFVEMQNDGYNGILLKGLYNVYDFTEDEILKQQVGRLLDLFWAYWAQEQIDGVQGGGRARIYQGGGDITSGGRHVQQLAWLYFGMCDPIRISSPILSAATSTYRPPDVVTDLALDATGRGVYEIHQRPLGLVKTGYFGPPDYRMRTDYGGIHRYSYCTPEFIIGTPMLEARPFEEWAMISSQNRWHGAIFSGHRNARIVPQCETDGDRVTFNQQWSVQNKGTLICQKLRTSTKCTNMRVWVAGSGLSKPQERDGWVFVESQNAYAAVCPTEGTYTWQTIERPTGAWMVLENEWSPVILEVAQQSEYADFTAFQNAVMSHTPKTAENVLTYTSIYGDLFTFDIDQNRPPQINNVPIDYAPTAAFDSPFLKADWNSGIVTIEKGERKVVLNFNV